jgi:hypothetical protein
LKEDIPQAWDVNIYTQLWSENVKGGNHFACIGVERRVMLKLVGRNVALRVDWMEHLYGD